MDLAFLEASQSITNTIKVNGYISMEREEPTFIDRHGYHYGYFNHRGYEFEGLFYRYDRVYTYRDRVRGRSLFENRYYAPIENFYD